MKIAVAQMNTRAGDFDATVERMLAYGRRAKSLGADLLVFPVPALMGLEPGALTQAEAYVADAAEAMAKLTHGLEVPSLVPFMFDTDGMTASDVALVRDGETIPLAFATWLSGAGDQGVSALAQNIREASGTQNLADEMIDLAEEVGPASSALGPAVVQISGVDVGIALTYDDLDSFALGDAAADVVCYLPMDGFNTDDEASCLAPAVADGCFLSEASEANSWLVAANAVGAYEDAVYCGGSFVLSPWGELAAAAPSFVEDLLVCDVDVLSEGPLAEAARPAGYDRSRFLWDACALATRDQVEKRGLAGAAVVLDGTLSSAAVAALAVDALGPMRVSALVCTQDGPSLADARATARSLRIRDVDELSARELERAVTMLGGEADASELAAGLVQARLGSMARAGSLLALSADDKTSLAVGLGEGSPAPVCRADAFAPFGDVYRSDVQRSVTCPWTASTRTTRPVAWPPRWRTGAFSARPPRQTPGSWRPMPWAPTRTPSTAAGALCCRPGASLRPQHRHLWRTCWSATWTCCPRALWRRPPGLRATIARASCGTPAPSPRATR